MVKRGFDLLFAVLALILLLPAWMVIGILIRREDGGPIFYRGRRVGRFGAPFQVFKFRTMVVDADQIGGPSSSDDDPRITRVGRVLRKYKLDETPQLINVLLGDMSLVGPRPEVASEVGSYSERERRLLSVRPGITDYASIEYHNEGEILRGAADPHEAYRRLIRPGKIALGLRYVETRSFRADLRILWLTCATLVRTRVRRPV